MKSIRRFALVGVTLSLLVSPAWPSRNPAKIFPRGVPRGGRANA